MGYKDNKKCLDCGHEWLCRVANPKSCPHCKSYDWNIKRNLNGGKNGSKKKNKKIVE